MHIKIAEDSGVQSKESFGGYMKVWVKGEWKKRDNSEWVDVEYIVDSNDLQLSKFKKDWYWAYIKRLCMADRLELKITKQEYHRIAKILMNENEEKAPEKAPIDNNMDGLEV